MSFDSTPAPLFMEACRQVLGITDPAPLTPAIVIPAVRDPVLGPKIHKAHAELILAADKETRSGEQNQKTLENRIRRKAARLGYRVTKSRERKYVPHSNNFGEFMLLDDRARR